MSGRGRPIVGVPIATPSISTCTLLIGEPSTGSAIQPLTIRLSHELIDVVPLALSIARSRFPKDPAVALTASGRRVAITPCVSIPTTLTEWLPADRVFG